MSSTLQRGYSLLLNHHLRVDLDFTGFTFHLLLVIPLWASMDANGNSTTQITQCNIYNTINHYSSASETKITTTTTALEETKITSTTAAEETIEEIPRINSTDSGAEYYTEHLNQFASIPVSHREVSPGLSFNKSLRMLNTDFQADRRSVVWQKSERVSQMQVHSEFLSSTAALLAAPHSKRMIPFLDWRLLQGPIRYREQMENYAKRDPLLVASLFSERDPLEQGLDQMLSWLSETIINVHKLCTHPMLLITLNVEMSYPGWGLKLKASGSFRIEVSIIETGYTTRIPRYQALHDPTRTRPRTILPTYSVPASTAKSSSSNNQQLIPAPKRKSPPKFGPKPPPVVPRPNTNQGVSRITPTRAQPSAIPLRAIEAPVTNKSIPNDVSKPSYSPPRYSRPVSGLRPSTQQDRSPKKEPTLTGQMEELKETVKKQGMILEKQNVLLERLTARLG